MERLGRGRRQREQANDMVRAMRAFEWDMQSRVTAQGRLPPEWRRIWEERSAKKARVTIRLDEDVVRFFRSMGAGYGPRMNGVLRSFMLARLSGLIEGEDLSEGYREAWMGKPRPSPCRAETEQAARLADVQEMLALSRKVSEARGDGRSLEVSEIMRLGALAERLGGAADG
ncbi:hypothetical protein JANAI62_31500 [Jannaschia pagri]|uniref:BrnA antitoxin of type II toxin-antitoxin system n=1 Tax=Jannaschia pagri TaxID=2829797 RepID=A0ABQ4NQ56_9RHOB|nr:MULTISPECIES: BrnA antitoxin family protein [unclassified Jannaschia]GIT92613.1 hypothetical protein JANAI61_30710 [Jannaschia sp. AI_61]GIT96527.1 hypothetical protein JANAI62_31500 [Jannaschia sp. AI_62]